MSILQTRSFRDIQDGTVASPDAVSGMIDDINNQINTFLATLSVGSVRDVQLAVASAGKYDTLIVVYGWVTYVN